jgi:hypothetical protein
VIVGEWLLNGSGPAASYAASIRRLRIDRPR